MIYCNNLYITQITISHLDLASSSLITFKKIFLALMWCYLHLLLLSYFVIYRIYHLKFSSRCLKYYFSTIQQGSKGDKGDPGNPGHSVRLIFHTYTFT